MTAPFAIELSPEEKALLAALSFLTPQESADYQRNGEIVLELTQRLIAREAIAEHRLRYFTDPQYHPSNRRQSRQDVFERNGCKGESILRHSHFLPHLRYFIFGANLPETLRNTFKAAVEECGEVTSGDIAPLADKAKALARRFGLGADVREEFYKLALDCGLSESDATAMRAAVGVLR